MEAKASFKKIVDYLTNLGTQHIDIADVFRWNKLEFSGSLRTKIPGTVMLIDSIEIKPLATNSKIINQNYCAFTILGKSGVSTAKLDAYAQQNEVLDFCQGVAFEIMARLFYDAETTNLQGVLKWLYNNVEKDSFHLFKVGPVFTEQLYGYRCEFTIKAPEIYTIDTTKWQDL